MQPTSSSGSPQRLSRQYGQEHTQKKLLAAYDACQEGKKSQLLIVTGASGVGKTSLIQSLSPQLQARGALVVYGAFHPMRLRTPFVAFRQALEELMQQLLAEPAAELEQWKRRVRTMLGNVGGALVELVPSLAHMVGPQKSVAEMSARDQESLLTMLQLRLFRAIGRHRPLVVTLENAQWADESSLRLMAALAQDPPGGNALLLVCAYRDDEVQSHHPLDIVLQKLAQNHVTVEAVAVPALSLDIVEQIASDFTGARGVLLQQLSQWLHAKTAGNAGAVELVLQHLVRNQLLSGNRTQGMQWQMQALAQANVPGSVPALLDACMVGLADQSLSTLALAGCLGQSFTPDLLATLAEQHPRHVKQQIAACVEAGLLTPTGPGENAALRFTNEQARTAALARMPRPGGVGDARSEVQAANQMTAGFAHEVRNALAGARLPLGALYPFENNQRGQTLFDATNDVIGRMVDVKAFAATPNLMEMAQQLRDHQEISRDMLETIYLGVERGLSITREIMEYFHVGHVVSSNEAVMIGPVVTKILREQSDRLNKRGITAETQIAGDLALPMKEEHAYAILRNLIANASDALAPKTAGERRIMVRANAAHHGVVVTVEDTGIGMSEETQAKVFEPFFTTKGAEGTGLGLGLSRKLAQVYGGNLRFVSRPAEGTKFELVMPTAPTGAREQKG